jgi:hypothetical protein
MKKRKKTYLLLELMISLALISLLAIPLIHEPFELLSDEVAALERMELERISELYFAEIKEKLYCNKIPWNVLEKKSKEAPAYEQETFIETLSKHRFKIKTSLWTKNTKKADEKESYHLIGVRLSFIPEPKGNHTKEISFLYRLFIKKENKKV